MEDQTNDILAKDSIFGWIAGATVLLLAIPLAASFVTDEMKWEVNDYVLMGILIFAISSLFVLVARVVKKKHRLVYGALFLFGFLWLWAELAVGVFTNWGS